MVGREVEAVLHPRRKVYMIQVAVEVGLLLLGMTLDINAVINVVGESILLRTAHGVIVTTQVTIVIDGEGAAVSLTVATVDLGNRRQNRRHEKVTMLQRWRIRANTL